MEKNKNERYFEGGVSSVFLWDLEDGGFAGVVLLKKSASFPTVDLWNPIPTTRTHIILLISAPSRHDRDWHLGSLLWRHSYLQRYHQRLPRNPLAAGTQYMSLRHWSVGAKRITNSRRRSCSSSSHVVGAPIVLLMRRRRGNMMEKLV